jgi:sugar/nucleoside kinase (ribokinase family)
LEHLKQPDIWSLVESSQIYFVGGYHLTVCPEAALALAEEAAAKNKVRSIRGFFSSTSHIRWLRASPDLCDVTICPFYSNCVQRCPR